MTRRAPKESLSAYTPIYACAFIWVCIAVFVCLWASGCSSGPSMPRVDVPDAQKSLTQAAGGYAVLDWIFAACMVLAALSVVLLFVAPGKAKPWATAGLVAAGVMAVALKVLLVKFMPWIIGAGLGAFVLSGLVFAYAHRWWIERRLHKDLDGDGKIGEPTA